MSYKGPFLRLSHLMSVTVDFFFNHPDNLAETAKSINGWLGCSLMPYEGNEEDLFCRFLAMEFSLSEHSLENDRDCNFEDYRYEIGFRVPAPDGDLRMMQIPAIALVIYTLLSRMGITGMLVYDVQLLLAKYEKRAMPEDSVIGLFDIVSNEFVSFPKHFLALQERLGED